MRAKKNMRIRREFQYRRAGWVTLFLLLPWGVYAQTSWRGTTSTAWETASNWTAGVPTSGSTVTLGDVAPTRQPTISSTVTISSLTFSSGGNVTLTIGAGGSLSITNNVTAVSGTKNRIHTFAIGSQSVSVGGSFTGALSKTTTNVTISTGSLSINGTYTGGASTCVFSGAGNLTIGGDYTGTGAFTSSTSTVTYNGSSAQAIRAITYNNLVINKSVGTTGTISANTTINGTFTVTQGIFSNTTGTLTVKGNITNSGTITQGTNELTLSGTTQSINGSGTFTLGSMTVNTGNTLTVNSNISLNTLTNNGTVNPGTSTFTFRGATFSLGANSKIYVNTSTFASNYSLNPTTINATSTVEYGSSAIDQDVAGINYGTLVISGGTTKTLRGTISFAPGNNTAGKLTISDGIFDLNGYAADRGATRTGGTLTLAAGATLRIGGTIGFPANFNTNTIDASSIVEYYGTAQTISNKSYGDLVLSGSGTKTAAGAITVNGQFTVNSGVTFAGSTFTHTFTGDAVVDGSVTGTGTLTLSGANSVFSGGVTSIAPNISVTGSGISFEPSANLALTGNLTVSGVGFTIPSSATISVGGNISTTGSGTITATAGTIAMTAATAARTINGNGISLNNFSVTSTTNQVSTTSSLIIAGNLSMTGNAVFSATNGIITLNGSSNTITASGTGAKTLYSVNILGNISTSSSFNVSGNLSVDVNGSLTASSPSVMTFSGTGTTSTFSGSADLYSVTVSNGTSKTLQLGANSILGISGSLTTTGATLNLTTTTPNTIDFTGASQTVPSASYYNISLSGGGTKTAGGSITVNGDLTIDASTTFSGASYTHAINGNWYNYGSFTPATSNVIFTGTNNSTITGATTFSILTVNKSSIINPVILASDVTADIVAMTSGNLSTGSNILTIKVDRSGNGNIIGTITREQTFSPGVNYTFESPNTFIRFASVSGVSSITVAVLNSSVNDFPFGAAINREYDITVNGGTYNTDSLCLHYEMTELNGNVENDLDIWRYSGSTWEKKLRSAYDTTSNWVAKGNVITLAGRWTLSALASVARWTGTVSNAWDNASNWTTALGFPTLPPTAVEIAVIGDAPFSNQPIISTAAAVKTLHFGSVQPCTLSISSSSSLAVGGNIGGTWSGSAGHVLNVASGQLIVGGSVALSDGAIGHVINLSAISGNITINGSLTQSGYASVSLGSGTLAIGGDFNYQNGQFTAGTSTVVYNGTNSQVVGGNFINYNNLTINKSSGTASLGSTATVLGNLTLSTGGTFDVNATLTVNGNVNIGSGTQLDGSLNTINVGGNWTNGGTFISNNGFVVFNGSSTQSIGPSLFNHLTVNKSSTATLIGNLQVDGNLTITNGTLNLDTYSANRSTFGGTLTIGSGAFLRIGNGNSLPANYATHNMNALSTVEFYGGSAQNIASSSYGNLTLTGASTKTLGGAVTVKGNLLINIDSKLNTATHPISLAGNWTQNAGDAFIANSGAVSITGSSTTVTGSVSFYDLSVSGMCSLVNNDSVTYALNVTGTLNVGSTTLTIAGNLRNNGSMLTSSGGMVTFYNTKADTLALNSGFVSSGTVEFKGNTAPVLASTSSPTYQNIIINNSAGIAPTTNWTVNGNFTITSGKFNGGSYSHTFKGDLTNNDSLVTTGALIFNPSGMVTLSFGKFADTGLVTLGGTGAIGMGVSAVTWNDLNITNTNTSGVTLNGGWIVNGDLAIAANSKLNLATSTLMLNGNLTNNGTISSGSTSTTTLNTSGTVTGSGTIALGNLTVSVSVNDSIVPPVTVQGILTNNGTLASSAVLTVQGSISNNSGAKLSTYAGTTIQGNISNSGTITTNDIITIQGNLTNSGTLTAGSDITIQGNLSNTGTFTNSGITVYFTGSSPSTIGGSSTAIDQLTIAKSGAMVQLNIAINSLTTLSVTSGLFDVAGYAISEQSGLGTFSIDANATFKTSGSAMPTFTSYDFDSLSTVEYYGSTQTITTSGLFNYGNLTISNAGTKTIGADTILGNITVNSGSTFATSNSTTLYLSGNWANSGTFLPGTSSTVRFIGSGNQTLTNSTDSLLNMNIDKTSGSLTLGSDVKVSGTLTFTNGKLTTGSNKVTIGFSGNVSGANSNSYVVGNLRKYFSNSYKTQVFEIGDNTTYARDSVVFSTVSTAGYLTSSTTLGDHPNILSSVINLNRSVNRYWSLTSGGVAGTYSATFNFVSGDIDNGAAYAEFSINRYRSAAWDTNLVIGTQNPNNITTNSNTYFGDYQVGEKLTGILPRWIGTALDHLWKTASNWSPAKVPDSTDNVFLNAADSIFIDTIAHVRSLAINNDTTKLTILTGNSLSIIENFTMFRGVLNTQATFPSVSGSVSFTGGTFGYTATSGSQTVSVQTYNNLIISGGGTKTAAGNIIIDSNLTINGGTLDIGTNTANRATNGGTLTLATGAALKVGGTSGGLSGSNFPSNFSTITLNGTVEYGSSGSQTVSVLNYKNITLSGNSTKTLSGNISPTGDINVTAGTFDLTTYTANLASGGITVASGATLRVGGGSGGQPGSNFPTATSMSLLGTVNFNGSTTQTIPALNFTNLTISNTGSVTLASSGTIGIAGTFTPGTATFTTTGSTINYNGSSPQTVVAINYNNLTVSNTSQVTLASGTIGIAGVFTPGTVYYTVIGNTVNYNGTTQAIASINYNNLTIAGSGTKSLARNDTINGDLTISAGTLDLGSYTLNRSSSGGILTLSTGATMKVGGGSGGYGNTSNFPSNFTTYTLSGTVEFNSSSSPQTIPSLTYTNLTLSNTGQKNIIATLTTNGDWTSQSGTVITIGSGVAVQVRQRFYNYGTITNSGIIDVGY